MHDASQRLDLMARSIFAVSLKCIFHTFTNYYKASVPSNPLEDVPFSSCLSHLHFRFLSSGFFLKVIVCLDMWNVSQALIDKNVYLRGDLKTRLTLYGPVSF